MKYNLHWSTYQTQMIYPELSSYKLYNLFKAKLVRAYYVRLIILTSIQVIIRIGPINYCYINKRFLTMKNKIRITYDTNYTSTSQQVDLTALYV